jgi:hypothetical protein
MTVMVEQFTVVHTVLVATHVYELLQVQPFHVDPANRLVVLGKEVFHSLSVFIVKLLEVNLKVPSHTLDIVHGRMKELLYGFLIDIETLHKRLVVLHDWYICRKEACLRVGTSDMIDGGFLHGFHHLQEICVRFFPDNTLDQDMLLLFQRHALR